MQTAVIWSPSLQTLVSQLKKVSLTKLETAISTSSLSLTLSEKNALNQRFIEKSTLQNGAPIVDFW